MSANTSPSMPPPSFERDAVRLIGLRRRADLNDCYGLVQAKYAADRFEVRIADESVLVKMANLNFVGHVPLVFASDGIDTSGDDFDPRKQGLVLDKFMKIKYMTDCTPLSMDDGLKAALQTAVETLT